MDTLLLIEDDKFLRFALKENLESENFVIMEAANGRRAVEILQRYDVDLILLDLGLPDRDGLDLIPDIRTVTEAPVIVVSGARDKSKKLASLTLGADDFIAKPCDMDELVARIRASLRRSRGHETAGKKDAVRNDNDSCAGFAGWIIDRARFQIFDANGKPGNLTIQEFRLLAVLAARAGQVLTREELCEALRQGNYIPSPRAIDIKIARIRRKIGDCAEAAPAIRTVRGAGYMADPDALKGEEGG